MRVPARVFADAEILEEIAGDRALEQLQNVATLPGIVDAAIAMPDIHQGYGFPVGGVGHGAFDGVVSPGGVGYDINCGVRLLALPLTEEELGDRRGRSCTRSSRVPAGVGKSGGRELGDVELDEILRHGPALRAFARTTSSGRSRREASGADPAAVSERERAAVDSWARWAPGITSSRCRWSTKSSIPASRRHSGSKRGQVTVLVHSGSRGLGHQVCTDYVRLLDAIARQIHVLDRQLARSGLVLRGRRYLAAMAAAANFAWANRQAIADGVRRAIGNVLGEDAAERTEQVYDVAHNVAKVEKHRGVRVCVHRKGATRAFPAGSDEIPAAYRSVGQPVFIPGSMGTARLFVLAGEPAAMQRSFGTTCHGAGRRLSRSAAFSGFTATSFFRGLEARGIVIRSPSAKGLAEEAPFAYKDVDRVVRIVERAGLGSVARLVPLGVVKG